ncbi:MAG: hypothetical protein U0350_39300 [Caldilineaceae bacterium]
MPKLPNIGRYNIGCGVGIEAFHMADAVGDRGVDGVSVFNFDALDDRNGLQCRPLLYRQ